MAPPPVSTQTARKKRPATFVAVGTSKSKKIRSSSVGTTGNVAKQPPDNVAGPDVVPSLSSAAAVSANNPVRERFLEVLNNLEYKNGISNSNLKELFGEADYVSLAPIINELTAQSRLTMSKTAITGELFYQLVSAEIAQQFQGLDVSAKMVYQCIERAGNMGIWTKDIRMQTNIQQQALNKVLKALEARQLIKPVKSVAAKSKKLYMLYNLTPSKDLTGGIWYSDLEFDHEFISELRDFLVQCVRRINSGKGVTLQEILEKMEQANICRVELSINEVLQLVQTLVFDYMVEEAGINEQGESIYVAARRVTPMCEFKWWDVLDPDFQYRNIRFEDGVVLSAHEPHCHT